MPRVTKLGVTSTSAVSEPRTTVPAATDFSRFRDHTAFETGSTHYRRLGCWCVYVGIGQNIKMKARKWSLLGLREDLSIYMALAYDVRLQAFAPSDQL